EPAVASTNDVTLTPDAVAHRTYHHRVDIGFCLPSPLDLAVEGLVCIAERVADSEPGPVIDQSARRNCRDPGCRYISRPPYRLAGAARMGSVRWVIPTGLGLRCVNVLCSAGRAMQHHRNRLAVDALGDCFRHGLYLIGPQRVAMLGKGGYGRVHILRARLAVAGHSSSS